MPRIIILIGLFAAAGGCALSKTQSIPDETGARPLMEERQPVIEPQAPQTAEPSSEPQPTDRLASTPEQVADQYLRQGNLSMAFAHYEKALERNPKQARVHYKTGMLLLMIGQSKEAQQRFQKAIEEDPREVQAAEGLGQAQFQLGLHEEAEDSFLRALQLDPRLWKSHAFLGLLYDARSQHEKALAEYRAALALKPGHVACLNNLGRAYYIRRRYGEAIQILKQAVETGGTDPRVYNNLALAFAKAGRYRDAFDAFRKGTDEAKAYHNLGVVYLETKQPQKARTCFEHAVRASPTFYAKANDGLTISDSSVGKSRSKLMKARPIVEQSCP